MVLDRPEVPGNMGRKDLPFIKRVNDGVKVNDGCAEAARIPVEVTRRGSTKFTRSICPLSFP